MGTVTGVDDRLSHGTRQEMRHPRDMVAHNQHVGLHRREIVGHVSQAFSLADAAGGH